jgi:hypothetical protein
MKNFLLIPVLTLTIILISCSGAPKITSYHKEGVYLNKNEKLAVIPSKFGKSQDLVLPDALETEFLRYGFKIVERTAVRQMVQEKGLDLTEILNGEEYFKIGEVTEIQNLVLVNSRMGTDGIASATMKIIDMGTNEVIFSSTYTQPTPDRPEYVNFDNINDTAERMVQSIIPIIKN